MPRRSYLNEVKDTHFPAFRYPRAAGEAEIRTLRGVRNNAPHAAPGIPFPGAKSPNLRFYGEIISKNDKYYLFIEKI